MLGQHGESATDATERPIVEVTVLEASSLGRTNDAGVGLFAVALSIGRVGIGARQAVVSSAVPSDCLGMLDGGTVLPARIPNADPDATAIDWVLARRSLDNSSPGGL